MTTKQKLGRMARIAPALTVLAVAAACGDDRGTRARVDIDDDSLFAGSEATLREGDLFAANTENGAIRLGLTRERVYFELSEQLREHVDSEIESGIGESENRIARSIGAAVRRGIAGALDVEIDYRVDDIRDIDYRDGELVFDFVDPRDGEALRSTDIDDEPITRAFSEDDARAFVAAFRRLKRADPSVAGSTPSPDTTAADTAGGSF
jgi:hypothetical protein